MRILVVDDESSNHRMYARILSNDVEVIVASNGIEGIQMAIRYHPDLIILDGIMPVMNGLEALIVLKKTDATRNIPVIMISGSGPIFEDKALESGAAMFLDKPFDPVAFIEAVKQSLSPQI